MIQHYHSHNQKELTSIAQGVAVFHKDGALRTGTGVAIRNNETQVTAVGLGAVGFD